MWEVGPCSHLLPSAASSAAVRRAAHRQPVRGRGKAEGVFWGCTAAHGAVLAAPGHRERHPLCVLLPLRSHKSLGSQRPAQTRSNAHKEVRRYAYACRAAQVLRRGPTGGTLQPHATREVQTPPAVRHRSGNPSHQRQERSVLHWSMQGAPQQPRAVRADISSRAGRHLCPGEKTATVPPRSCQEDTGSAGWHGRRLGFKGSS